MHGRKFIAAKVIKHDHNYLVLNVFNPLHMYFNPVMETFNLVLTFESVDEILWCHLLNETSSAVLSFGTTYI